MSKKRKISDFFNRASTSGENSNNLSDFATNEPASNSENAVSVQFGIYGILGMLFWGYVALGYTSDPESCIASDQVERRI